RFSIRNPVAHHGRFELARGGREPRAPRTVRAPKIDPSAVHTDDTRRRYAAITERGELRAPLFVPTKSNEIVHGFSRAAPVPTPGMPQCGFLGFFPAPATPEIAAQSE